MKKVRSTLSLTDALAAYRDLRWRALSLLSCFGKESLRYNGQLVVGPIKIIEAGKEKYWSVVKKANEKPDDSANSGGILILEHKGGEEPLTLHLIENNPPLNTQDETIARRMKMASGRLALIEAALANSSPLDTSSIRSPFVEGLRPQPVSP